MSKEVGIEEARKNLGDLANLAFYAGETTYITRRGKRIAAIVPVDQAPNDPITSEEQDHGSHPGADAEHGPVQD